jgi:N-acetylglucosaminyl-diphospho-decaprenol L-rhamnosyltransferase
MKASVLIVGFHTYDELGRCLASLETHERDVEVIVVDHDADPARGRELVAAHPRIKYDPTADNRGFGAGVNRAARQATAPLLLILNPDVELRAPVVGPLIACLDAHPQTAIVGGLVREPDGRVQASARRFPDVTTPFGGRTSWLTRVLPGNPLSRRNLAATDVHGGCTQVDWVTGAFMIVRREVFESLGGFDERFFMYWEDSDLCLRALQAGWKTMYEPSAEVLHATGQASRHAPVRSLVAFHRSVFHHYWKHGSWRARLAAPLVAAGLVVRLGLKLLAGGLAGSRTGGTP